MKSNNFYSLCDSINGFLQQQNHSFIDINNLLFEYTREDYLSMFNALLDEVINCEKLPKVREQHMYLLRKSNMSLVLRLLGKQEKLSELSASAYDAYLLNLSNKRLEIPRLRCQIDKNDLSIRPPALSPMEPLVLNPDSIYFQPSFESLLLLNKCHEKAPLLIFRSPYLYPSTWEFDLNSLTPNKRVATELQSSRIQVALKVLSTAQNIDCIETLEQLCLSKQPDFLRWEAVQLVYKFDKSKGIKIVKKLSQNDSCKSLQRVARETLKQSIGAHHD